MKIERRPKKYSTVH